FDPVSETFTKLPIPGQEPPNVPGFGNFSVGPDGGIWFARNKGVQKFDPKTGRLLDRVPFTIDLANPYDNIITDDGNFWAGGPPAWRPDAAVQSAAGPLDPIRAARALLARPANLDRQFHHTGHCLVRGPQQLRSPCSGPGIDDTQSVSRIADGLAAPREPHQFHSAPTRALFKVFDESAQAARLK